LAILPFDLRPSRAAALCSFLAPYFSSSLSI
jgi:hypothetical protein